MLQVKHPSSHLTANWTMSVLVAAAAKVSGEAPRCLNLGQCRCLYHCGHDGWNGIVESRHYRTGWVEVGADADACAGDPCEYRIRLSTLR